MSIIAQADDLGTALADTSSQSGCQGQLRYEQRVGSTAGGHAANIITAQKAIRVQPR